MANETSFNISFRSLVTSVPVKDSFTSQQDRSNSEFTQNSVQVTATHQQLAIPGTVTEQYFVIRNLGDNVVHVQTGSSGTTGRFATLPATGGVTVFPLASGLSIYVVCETGQTSDIIFTILSN